MVRWDGGVERQCGWSYGQVERWICRWVKVDRWGGGCASQKDKLRKALIYP